MPDVTPLWAIGAAAAVAWVAFVADCIIRPPATNPDPEELDR